MGDDNDEPHTKRKYRMWVMGDRTLLSPNKAFQRM